jgi:hypothetical protein
MKGSDSAMPIWADFTKEALDRHPEWNGDWTMPVGVRKAEIDTRNGALIRELDALEATNTKPSPSPSTSPTPKDSALDDPDWATSIQPETPEIYVTDVPAEFRRIELFVPGTVPGRAFLKTDEIQYDPETGEPITPAPTPEKSPTPINETWEEQSPAAPSSQRNQSGANKAKSVMVIICPITGMRATAACPKSEMRSFAQGSEPKDFCAFHR